MQESASKNWRTWRLTAGRKDSAPQLDLPPARASLLAERPGPDGIRWGLVNRVRAEIAAGTYDTEEKFALVEERLLALCE